MANLYLMEEANSATLAKLQSEFRVVFLNK
jgi:hypothetical protein